jgi:hypothetical protein
MKTVVREVASGWTSVVLVARRGLRRRLILRGLYCLCLLTGFVVLAHAGDDPQPETDGNTGRIEVDLSEVYRQPSPKTEPLVLDLSEFYRQPSLKANKQYEELTGRRVMDGLPFQIDGQVRLYGETPNSRGEQLPDTRKGIRIGRKFDELHLIHHTTWPDAEGQTVAYVCLNYADGTECIFAIRYGVHVRDWFNLPSYEKESVTDPNTTICWRRSPVMYKAPVRIFKSKFENPSPRKVVATMDIVSARNLAAYNLLAATVANRDPGRATRLVGDRSFNGKLVIRVVDNATGKPIEGTLVVPGMNVLDEGVVASPFHTSSAGEGTIPYPIKDTRTIFASVKKEGYRPVNQGWERPIPGEFTFRLAPVGAATGAEN